MSGWFDFNWWTTISAPEIPVLHQIVTALHVLPHNFEGARLLLLKDRTLLREPKLTTKQIIINGETPHKLFLGWEPFINDEGNWGNCWNLLIMFAAPCHSRGLASAVPLCAGAWPVVQTAQGSKARCSVNRQGSAMFIAVGPSRSKHRKLSAFLQYCATIRCFVFLFVTCVPSHLLRSTKLASCNWRTHQVVSIMVHFLAAYSAYCL
jgi:hypothetical protein